MYNPFYKLVKVKKETYTGTISDQPEEWIYAKDNKMSMFGSLANAIVETVKNSGIQN